MRFEIYRGRRGLQLRAQWRWRLKAANGRIVATSGEGYNNRADALSAIDLVREKAPGAPVKETVMIAAGAVARAIGVKGGIIIALGLVLAIALWRADSLSEQRDEARAALTLAEAELALLRTDAALKETAAEQRQADTAAVARTEKELIDAIQQVPDEQPDAVRVRLGCERLRRAGRVGADLPGVCRPGG